MGQTFSLAGKVAFVTEAQPEDGSWDRTDLRGRRIPRDHRTGLRRCSPR